MKARVWCWTGDRGPAGERAAAPARTAPAKPPATVVGMQAPGGWEQTYGELGRGLYGEAADAGTRIHPTRTFVPGMTYEPEARTAPQSGRLCALRGLLPPVQAFIVVPV
jgi:hypothetical protein